MNHYIAWIGILFCCATAGAQVKHRGSKDSIAILQEVTVTGYKTVNGVGHLLETQNGVVYAGKKTEVIVVDSLDANKALNNTRQILGRIPGLNIVETEASGFTANGIATRGLNPSQSIEMNTRQNGYNISADIYGYNEAYYLPAMEGVRRIELVRGAAALQFGAQFGGLVNYIMEEVPKDKPFQFLTAQTVGSYGLYNSFTSAGGNAGKWSYYGFFQNRTLEGYRPNSTQTQQTGFGKIGYQPNKKWRIGLEYSFLRNKIQMPGGLSDSLFAANPKASIRARNWLRSPWNIVTNTIHFQPTERTSLDVQTTFLFSNRALVWRNEDGGASVLDTIDPSTGKYIPREVGAEKMNNITTEARFLHHYKLWKQENTLAAGVRLSHAWFKRQGGGEGTTGSDFDLSHTGEWGYDLDYTTTNVAPFVENIFKIGRRLTITPGARLEVLHNTVKGYQIDDVFKIKADNIKDRTLLLLGIGTEYKLTPTSNLYANISQAYRPIDYSQLSPFGVAARIDPNLKDAFGFNSDLGYRCTIKQYLNVDVSLFYMQYNNRISELVVKDAATGNDYAYRTNVGNSIHAGLEAYIEFNILKYLAHKATGKGLSIFNSYSYVDAHYTSGIYKNNRVEAAAKHIERFGIIYNNCRLSSTFQFNYIGDAFGDASNVRVSDNPIAGYIPSYTVLDWSASYRLKHYALKAGVNNLLDKQYFTRRTDEYPGPGIIPAVGRSLYLGFTVKL